MDDRCNHEKHRQINAINQGDCPICLQILVGCLKGKVKQLTQQLMAINEPSESKGE